MFENPLKSNANPSKYIKRKETMDLIVQNSGNKQIHLFSGITPTICNNIYCQIDNIDMDMLDGGEYYYALSNNSDSSATYEFKADLLDTLVTISGKTYTLRDFDPITGIMRIGGMPEQNNTYEKKKNKTYYYKK